MRERVQLFQEPQTEIALIREAWESGGSTTSSGCMGTLFWKGKHVDTGAKQAAVSAHQSCVGCRRGSGATARPRMRET